MPNFKSLVTGVQFTTYIFKYAGSSPKGSHLEDVQMRSKCHFHITHIATKLRETINQQVKLIFTSTHIAYTF